MYDAPALGAERTARQIRRGRILARLGDLKSLRSRVELEIATLELELERMRARAAKGARPKCGTDRGYQWHKRYGEPQDEACKRAHATYTAMLRARARGAL